MVMAFPVGKRAMKFGTIFIRRWHAPNLRDGCFYGNRNMWVKSKSLVNQHVPVPCRISPVNGIRLLEHNTDAVLSVPITKRYVHVDTSATSQKTESVVEDETKYENVYRFKLIVHAKVLSRLKIYQTGITVVALPTLTSMYAMGTVPVSTLIIGFGVSTVAAVMLYVMSYYSRHMVGILRMDRRGEQLQISHLSFWGKKLETVLKVSDIIPLTDTNQNVDDAFVLLKSYDGKYKFYMFHKAGQVYDKDALMHILGQVSITENLTNGDIEKVNKVKANRE